MTSIVSAMKDIKMPIGCVGIRNDKMPPRPPPPPQRGLQRGPGGTEQGPQRIPIRESMNRKCRKPMCLRYIVKKLVAANKIDLSKATEE